MRSPISRRIKPIRRYCLQGFWDRYRGFRLHVEVKSFERYSGRQMRNEAGKFTCIPQETSGKMAIWRSSIPGVHTGAPLQASYRESDQGGQNEQRASAGRNEEGRVYSERGWQAQRLEGEGPVFAGWEMYHLKGSPADPNRIYASQCSGWFGQLIQRSDDGGATWNPGGQQICLRRHAGHAPVVRRHARIRGSSSACGTLSLRSPILTPSMRALKMRRFQIRGRRQELAGAERAARPGRRADTHAPQWQPGAGGMGLHTIILDPTNSQRMYIAISAAGAFRTEDGGTNWKPINKGLVSELHARTQLPKWAIACTMWPCIARGPRCCLCRSTGT